MAIKIAYDIKKFRPGCPLLQAAYGGSSAAAQMFPDGSWLLAPTDDLKGYVLRDETELQQLIQLTERNFQREGG